MQKMLGLCATENDKVGTKAYGRMLKRIQLPEEGRMHVKEEKAKLKEWRIEPEAEESKNWKREVVREEEQTVIKGRCESDLQWCFGRILVPWMSRKVLGILVVTLAVILVFFRCVCFWCRRVGLL